MVKDHSESERGNLLLPHGLLFPINSKDSFICTIPDRIAHTTAFVTPVVEHWLEHMYNEDKQAISLCQGMTLTFYFFRMNSTYHGLCYTSRGALAGTRNSSLKR